MKKKTIILLSALLAVIALFFILRRNNSNTLTGDDRDFQITSTDKIDKIFLSNKKTGNYVVLKKLDSLNWIANDTFKVNIHQIETLFEGFRKMQIKRPVGKNELNVARKDIAVNGTKVEIYENGSISKVYYVGGNTPDNMGTYFLMDKAEQPYVIHIPGFNGFIGARYHHQLVAWRSKNIFSSKENEIKTIDVNWVDESNKSFRIGNEGKEPVLSSGNKTFTNNIEVNLNMIKSYLKLWENLSFEGIPIDLNAHLIDSISKTKPFLILELTNKSGTKTKLSIHRKGIKRDSNIQLDDEGNPLQFDVETFYAFINDNSKEVVQIQDYVFGKVMKTTQDFLIEK